MANVFSSSFADTGQVAPEQQVEYWNAYNRDTLVGLRSSSLSSHGLLAKRYAAEHLMDPEQSFEQVAAVVGVSVRQLGRLFRQ